MGEREGAGFVVRRADRRDAGRVAALLRTSGLPVDGLEAALDHALVASRDGRLVGCVALELYGESALLRSLAIVPELRGQGLGGDLTRGALDLARTLGAQDVYLLTETASGFFPRFGFTSEERPNAPDTVQNSVEFRSACPKSALLMHARVGS
jgi:N-acetylglutamate synthase-like GNAT family acetyltransferase